jgi:hypothetical protein
LVGDQVKRTIGGSFSISHSTLELECERCIDSDGDPCPMDATGLAATERVTVHHH